MRQVVGCDSESEVKTGCKNLTKRNVLVAHLRRKPSSERAELAILVHCKVPHIHIHIDVVLVSEGMQKCRNISIALFAFFLYANIYGIFLPQEPTASHSSRSRRDDDLPHHLFHAHTYQQYAAVFITVTSSAYFSHNDFSTLPCLQDGSGSIDVAFVLRLLFAVTLHISIFVCLRLLPLFSGQGIAVFLLALCCYWACCCCCCSAEIKNRIF